MIIGVGVDIIDHKIIAKLGWENPKTLKRIFSDAELEKYYISKKLQFLIGLFHTHWDVPLRVKSAS